MVTLPFWASQHPTDSDTILVDPDLAYPKILKQIAACQSGLDSNIIRRFPIDPRKPSRYWLEVAFQFVKMDLQNAVGHFGLKIHIRGDDGRKLRWHHSMFPGTQADVHQATKGLEAKLHYACIRGFVPQDKGN